MKNKLSSLLFFFISIFLITNISQAQESKIFKFKIGEPFKWGLSRDLKLSEEQKKKFNELDIQYEKKMIDLRADLEKAKLAKKELINRSNFSKSDYLAAEEKIIQAENKIRMEKEKLKMEKYELLDNSQKKTFLERKDRDFIFRFDIDEFKDEMFKLKERIRKIIPCPPIIDDLEKEIEIEVNDNEI